jgi:arylsulfatase A-like enzyme
MSPSRSTRIILALAVLLAACGDDSPRPPNVLLVVIDTLRADKLGAYGNQRGLTPFLDSLVARGTVFEHAYAASSWTVPSMASLFTSRYPTQHRVVTFAQRIAADEVTVGERLQQGGWVGGGFAANPNLQSRFGYAQGFAEWHADAPENGEVDGDTLRAQSIAWLDRVWRRTDPMPTLLYVHYMEPHAPYASREPFRSRFAVNDAGRALDQLEAISEVVDRATGGTAHVEPDKPFELAATLARLLEQGIRLTHEHVLPIERLYDAEVATADDQVRQLFDELAHRGFLDHAMVIVTADHGEEFNEHGHGSHGIALYEESVRVPLIMMGPGVPTDRRVTENVSLVDVAPTLLDLLGLPPEPRFEGRSLVSVLSMPATSERGRGSGPDVILQLEQIGSVETDQRKHVRGLVRSGHKLLVGPDERTELYNLDVDPDETHDDASELAADRDILTGALTSEGQRLGKRAVSEVATEPIDERLKGQLRALGYLGN